MGSDPNVLLEYADGTYRMACAAVSLLDGSG